MTRSIAPDPAALVAAGADVGNAHPFPPAIDAPWMEEAHGHVDTRPETPPPADDRADLVRHDLAATALHHGMRCVAGFVMVASSRGTWDMIADDLASARVYTGDSQKRRVLAAAHDAAFAMSDGNVTLAVASLAVCCHETSEEWLASQRAARDEREGGDGLVPERAHLRSRAQHDAGERDDGVSRR